MVITVALVLACGEAVPAVSPKSPTVGTPDPHPAVARTEPEHRPASIGAVPLTESSAFPEEYVAAVSAVVAELERDGEVPAEFHAVVSETAEHLEFALWHVSAFLPENRGVAGNPGGRCRTFLFEHLSGRIVKKGLWQ